MKNIFKHALGLFAIMAMFSFILLPSAQAAVAGDTILDGLNTTAGSTELPQGTTDLKATIGTIIQVFLGFLGIIAVVIIIYAGFTWMTAGGDDTKVGNAKKLIINATVGIVIILAAYIITSFIITEVQTSLGS
jgi:type IV secretory pathway VirB2 component (pilin)